MCLIRTYEDDLDYPPPRRVIRSDSYRRRRSISHSPPPPIIGIRRRISVSPVRTIRERLSRVSVEEHKPRRSLVHHSRQIVALPKPPTPPPAAPAQIVREVEVCRSIDGSSSTSSSNSSSSSSSSSSGTKCRSHGTSTVKYYDTPGGKDYAVHTTTVKRQGVREWTPVRWNMDTSKAEQRSRSRSRPARGELYYEDPPNSGVYRREGGRYRGYH